MPALYHQLPFIAVAMLLQTCKFILITSLSAVFIVYFGHPSYIKYHRKDTVFTEATVEDGQIHPPAIRIYAWRRELYNGWKNSTFGDKNSCHIKIEIQSNASGTFDNFVHCINDETFKLDDILLSAESGNNNLTNDAFWATEITIFTAGKSYSLSDSQLKVEKNI